MEIFNIVMNTVFKLIIVIILIGVGAFCMNLNSYIKRWLMLMEHKINMSTVVNNDEMNMLEKIITECYMEYTVLNLEYNDDLYINVEMEKEITKSISNMILNRVSPIFINRLGLIYDTNNLDKIIFDKVYIFVTNYAVQKNKAKPNKK